MEPTGIKPGTKLTLGLYSRKNDDQSFSLSSTFECDEQNGEFLIAAPFYMNSLYPIQPGELLFVSFSDKDARYDMQGTVTDRFKEGDLAFVRVNRITEIVRTQRREDFRLEVVLDIDLERMLEKNERFFTHVVKARTIDLSGGGSALYCDEYIPEGEKIVAGLPIGEKGGLVYVNSEIRWIRRGEPEASYKYFVGLKFLFKQNTDKEKVVKYIFGLQRKRMNVSAKKVSANPFDDLI